MFELKENTDVRKALAMLLEALVINGVITSVEASDIIKESSK